MSKLKYIFIKLIQKGEMHRIVYIREIDEKHYLSLFIIVPQNNTDLYFRNYCIYSKILPLNISVSLPTKIDTHISFLKIKTR